MRNRTSLLVLALLMLVTTGLCNNNTDLVYLRKVYLIELGVPPSVAEIEWLLTYERNPRVAGIDYILSKKYGNEETAIKKSKRSLYLCPNQLITEPTPLSRNQLEFIIKYQSGNISLDIEEAKFLLIKCALSTIAAQEEPIDYLSVCLFGKYTNTIEFNFYNKIFNQTKGDDDQKLYAVLTVMMASNSFLYY